MALDRPGKGPAVPHTERERVSAGGGWTGGEGSPLDRDVLLHSCCSPSEP